MDMSGIGNMLSAIPGGFQQGQIANNQIDQQQLQLADQRAKQMGAAAYFRALQTMMGPQGGQGPQPPAPGQPSISSTAIPGQQMMPPMAMNGGQPMQGSDGGMLPPDMAMQTQPASGATALGGPPGGQQQLTWQGIIKSLKTSNPNASDLELAHAVDHFMPMMTMQNRLEWQQMKNELMYEMAGMRAATQQRGQDIRADTTSERTDVMRQREEGVNTRFSTAEDRRERSLSQRDQQFQQREQRLQDALKLRGDTTWARLDQQKQQAQQRIQAGDRRQAVIEWRAAVDAQHKLAMEKIQATNISSGMKPADRDKLLADQNAWYRGEIERLKNMTTQRGNISDEQEIPGSRSVTDLPTTKAPPVAPAAGNTQPVPQAFAGDADGTKYKKGDQTWVKQGNNLVLENGAGNQQ